MTLVYWVRSECASVLFNRFGSGKTGPKQHPPKSSSSRVKPARGGKTFSPIHIIPRPGRIDRQPKEAGVCDGRTMHIYFAQFFKQSSLIVRRSAQRAASTARDSHSATHRARRATCDVRHATATTSTKCAHRISSRATKLTRT